MKKLKIPELWKKLFDKAYGGNSKASALKAKCLDCSCFNREEVRSCTVQTCPLWIYRPYQNKLEEELDNESEE